MNYELGIRAGLGLIGLCTVFFVAFPWGVPARVPLSSVDTVVRMPRLSPVNSGSGFCRGDPVAVERETQTQTAFDAVDFMNFECSKMTPEMIDSCKVPNVLHYSLSCPGNFDFFKYLSVKSGHDRMRPDAIYVHIIGDCDEIPPYLQRAIDEFKVILVAARPVDAIFDRPVNGLTHKSDVVRMETLIRFGGVYIDFDVYVLQSLDVFYDDETTSALENDHGLNTGILIAKRCSRFLRKWYNRWVDFNDNNWGYHPINLPYEMWKEDPSFMRAEWETLPSDWPRPFDMLLLPTPPDPAYWKPIRAIHSFIRGLTIEYTEETVQQADNNLGLMVRRIMQNKPGMFDEP
jgi:hypothetical protein